MAVCVGVELYGWRQETINLSRRFVVIDAVLRRNLETGVPNLERLANVGTCNADGDNKKKLEDLRSWIEKQVRTKKMTSSVTIPHTDTPWTAVEQLPRGQIPLPAPRSLPTTIPEDLVDGLVDHFTVTITASELYYQCDLTDDQKSKVSQLPPFSINLYEMRLKWNTLADDWNTEANEGPPTKVPRAI